MSTSWTNPGGVTTNDTFAYATYSGGFCGAYGLGISLGVVSSYVLSGLLPSTAYCLEVSAWTINGQSPNATLTDVVTLPSTPSSFRTIPTPTPTSISTAWGRPPGAILNFSVNVATYSSGCGAYGASTSLGNVTSHIFAGLTSSQAYCLEVFAWSAAGDGSAATLVYLPAAPTSFAITATGLTTLATSWTNPAGTLVNDTAYYASYSGGSCGAYGSGISLGVATTYTFSGLAANSTYCLEVAAYTSAGEGLAVALLDVSTSTNLSASFVYAPASVTVGVAETFTPTVTGGTGPYSYAWAFGDGGTSTATAPTHTYSVSGSKTVYLNVTDSASHTASYHTTLIVASAVPPPVSGIFSKEGYPPWSVLDWYWTLPNLTASGIDNLTLRIGSTCGSWTTTYSIGVVAEFPTPSLSASSSYCVAVNTWNGYRASSLAYDNASTTPNTGVVVFPPTDLAVQSYTNTTVTITWSNLGQVLTNVTIYSGTNESSLTPTNPHEVTQQWTFSGLLPGTLYWFAVRDWNGTVMSPVSAPINQTTAGLPPSEETSFLPTAPNLLLGSVRTALANTTGELSSEVFIMGNGTSETTIRSTGSFSSAYSLLPCASAPTVDCAVQLASNVTTWTDPYPAYTILSARTYVNTTSVLSIGSNRSAFSPAYVTGILSCGSATAFVNSTATANLTFDSTCATLDLYGWSGGAGGIGGKVLNLTSFAAGLHVPGYSVLRVVTYQYAGGGSVSVTRIVAGAVRWTAAGANAVASVVLASSANASFTSRAWTSVALVVPLPPNNTWVVARSSFYFVGGAAYTPNWTITNDYFVANWAGFPVGVSETYTISMAALSGAPVLYPTTPLNGTGPPPLAVVPSVLSLTLGNYSTATNGTVTGSVVWSNAFALTFNGSVALGSATLSNAAVEKVTVGGTLLPPSAYVSGPGFLNILPGFVTVASGALVKITVLLTPGSILSPSSAIFLLDGFAVTAPFLLVLLGVAFDGGYYFYRDRRPGFKAFVGIPLFFVCIALFLAV